VTTTDLMTTVTSVREDPDAACRGQDPTLWDLDHETHRGLSHRCVKCQAALALCQRCPVRRRCADEAVATHDVYTIRGGWPMVLVASRRPRHQSAPAVQCVQCGLPVLRGARARFCSTICGRVWAATARRTRQPA